MISRFSRFRFRHGTCRPPSHCDFTQRKHSENPHIWASAFIHDCTGVFRIFRVKWQSGSVPVCLVCLRSWLKKEDNTEPMLKVLWARQRTAFLWDSPGLQGNRGPQCVCGQGKEHSGGVPTAIRQTLASLGLSCCTYNRPQSLLVIEVIKELFPSINLHVYFFLAPTKKARKHVKC